jgi:hypothetical protein
MNEENFQKFTNRSKKNKFRPENGKKRNKRERRSDRHNGKQIINDLMDSPTTRYNTPNDDSH